MLSALVGAGCALRPEIYIVVPSRVLWIAREPSHLDFHDDAPAYETGCMCVELA